MEPILITGGQGQLGQALEAVLRERGYTVHAPGRNDLDVTRREVVRHAITTLRPAVVFHLAAWTRVDACEEDPDRAFRIHVEGTRHVVEAAREVGAWVWMASTDYVFDGTKGFPYEEGDAPRPLNVYGRTKFEAERMVLDYPRGWVVRTSWVFGTRPDSFVRKVLTWARRGRIRVVADQVGSPTYTVDLARAAVRFVEEGLPSGLYHLANAGMTSRYEWARFILESVGWRVPLLPACTHDFPSAAPRPRFTPLKAARWEQLGLPPLPDWKDATRRFLQTLP